MGQWDIQLAGSVTPSARVLNIQTVQSVTSHCRAGDTTALRVKAAYRPGFGRVRCVLDEALTALLASSYHLRTHSLLDHQMRGRGPCSFATSGAVWLPCATTTLTSP